MLVHNSCRNQIKDYGVGLLVKDAKFIDRRNNMNNYDYIVIGAGSAGCVVANRLTQDPETTVLLIEAGNPDTKPEIQIPLKCTQLPGTEVDWGYFCEPEPALNNRQIFCPRGKVLGGSSAINFLLYTRGNHDDYDRWQELGNSGWSDRDLLPYFKKSEHQQRGASEYHGVDGELSVTDILNPAPISQRFIDAAVALGYERNPDFNGARQEGVGYFQFTVKDGKRHSAAAAFLLPILDRPNLTTITGTLVTRLLFEDTRTVGVEYLQEGMLHQARVNSEVILSAGGFDSPKLLMLSGIGNKKCLETLNIPVVVREKKVVNAYYRGKNAIATALAFIANLFLGMSAADLGVACPRSGGLYDFTREIFGGRFGKFCGVFLGLTFTIAIASELSA